MRILLVALTLISAVAPREAKADACEDATKILNDRIEEDARVYNGLLAAQRQEAEINNGKPNASGRLLCEALKVNAKNEAERLEFFSMASRACGNHLGSDCDYDCRMRHVIDRVIDATRACLSN